MSDLVTGEAVVVELRVAELASRLLALVVDGLVQLTVLVAGTLLLAGLGTDPALAAGLTLLLAVAVLVGYPATCETLTRGRTLGKLALGLRVVREDGGPVRLRQALVRALAAVVEIWALSGVVAFVVALTSSRSQRVGDLLAGTLVVRDRSPAARSGPAGMPPGLAGWAEGLDLSRLPGDLALAARQYLTRWAELDPGARAAMGARLAGAVAEHVSPTPPPGVSPEAYLAAVLAERRRRQTRRLGGTDVHGWRPAPSDPHAAGPSADGASDRAAGPNRAGDPAGPFAPPS